MNAVNALKLSLVAGQATGGDISSIVNNLTQNLSGQLSLILSGIAILALIGNAIWGIIGGSEDGSRVKKNALTILFWYVVGLGAAQIIGYVTSLMGGGGYN